MGIIEYEFVYHRSFLHAVVTTRALETPPLEIQPRQPSKISQQIMHYIGYS
jgi:hypothetical protein